MEIAAEPSWGSMPDRPWDTSVWVANTERIRDDLGWQPRYPFVEGFRRTLEWLRDSPLRTMYDAQRGNT